MSSGTRWTDAQLKAIRTTGGTLLVSAAAGSGKTAVLAERCVYLTCDAPDRCDIDRLLVVTFTRAAAAEMRARIGKALQERRASFRDDTAAEHLTRQLRLLDQADITTLDSFCVQVCRQNFERLGIDPRFVVLDPVDARLMRSDLAGRAIDEALANNAALRELININFNGRLGGLADAMLDTHALMGAQADGHAWLDGAVNRIERSSMDPAAARELLKPLADALIERLDRALNDLAALLDEANHTESAEKHAALIARRLDACRRLRDGFVEGDRLTLESGLADLKQARAFATREGHPAKSLAERLNAVKARLDSTLRKPLMNWTLDELMQSQANILPRVRAFADAVGRFDRAYHAAKQALQAMDFADVESLALHALCDDLPTLTASSAAVSLNERYAHVLVDEYQDINPLQDAILSLASTRRRSTAAGGPASNLFCVGDVKQSIYGFRLAEPEHFIAMADALSPAAAGRGGRVDLQHNFRSRAEVLDAANFVFEHLFSRDLGGVVYDTSHRLHVGATYPPPVSSAPAVELQIVVEGGDEPEDAPDDENDDLDRLDREGTLLARAIRDMIAPSQGDPLRICQRTREGSVERPARFSDVAVLLRARRQRTLRLAAVLRREGIPVSANDPTGFFDQVEVLDLLSLLQTIDNASQDIPLAAVIRAPWAGPGNRDDLLAEIRLGSPGIAFHQAVHRFAASEHPHASQVAGLCAKLARWREVFREKPLDDAIDVVIDESGLGLFVEGLSDPAQRRANLDALRSIARQVAGSDRPTLARLVATLNDLRKADDTPTPASATSDDAVAVMSIHGSKGLEFPIVFVCEMGKKFNDQDLKSPLMTDRHAGIGLHAVDAAHPARWPSLASMAVAESIRGKIRSEELRTLYVAMTRARERLIMIGSAKRKELDRWLDAAQGEDLTPFLRDATSALQWLVPILAQPEAASLVRVSEVAESSISSSSPRGWESSSRDHAEPEPVLEQHVDFVYAQRDQTLERATRAVTSLKQKILVSRPRPRRDHEVEGTVIGDVVHRVFERLDYAEAATADQIDRQIHAMIDAGHLTDEEAQWVDRESIVWLASSSLGDRLRAPGASLRRELAVSALQEQTLLRGRIDLLLLEPGRATVIDFKSDRVDASGLGRLTDIYRPQIEAYLEVLGRIVPDRTVSGVLAFLTPRQIVEIGR